MKAGVEFTTPANVKVSLEDRKWHINDRVCENKIEALTILKGLLLATGTEETLAQDQAREAVDLVDFIAKNSDWYKRVRYE